MEHERTNGHDLDAFWIKHNDFIERIYKKHPGLRKLRPQGWTYDEKVTFFIQEPTRIHAHWQLVINDIELREEARPLIAPLRPKYNGIDGVLVLSPVQ
jgi:hypothetical protein